MNKKMRILWVEDDAFTLDSMTCALKDAGYNITIALDAAMALDALKKSKFDLMLLDIYLPVGDCKYIDKGKKYIGIEILKLINMWEIRIPTIIFSVIQSPELGDLTDLGVKDMLYKARLMPDELLAIIERNLEIF